MRFKHLMPVCLVALAALQTAGADALRPITHEDIWTLGRVGTPVIGAYWLAPLLR